MSGQKIFIFGGSGFVGRNLIEKLIKGNYQVKVLAGDVLKLDSFLGELENNSIIFYLIHGLGKQTEKAGLLQIEEKAADNLIKAARIKKAKQIIHLTGIYFEGQKLSPHLLARKLTLEKIKNSGIPYTILRTSIIFGRGSISFEIIKAMLFKMPFIPLLRWKGIKVSPIHIDDVISSLAATIENQSLLNKIIDIGGPEIFTYEVFLKKLSQFLELKSTFFNFPFNLFFFSSFFAAKIISFPQREVYFLFQSSKNDCYCGPEEIEKFFGIKPKSIFDRKLFQ